MTSEQALAFSSLFSLILTTVLALLGWRVADFQSNKIAILKSKLEKQLHVHKLTFGTEFLILSDLWSKLVDLTAATKSLRPLMDSQIRGDETYDKRKKERLKNFSGKYQEFDRVVQKNKPFYRQTIYDSVFKLMMISADEAAAYGIRDPNQRPLNADYWDQALKHQLGIIAAADKVCEAIRKEIFMLNPQD